MWHIVNKKLKKGLDSMTYVYLFLAIVAEVIATSALKPGEGFTKLGPSLLVISVLT